MTMPSPKDSLSKPIDSRVVRADHRAVSYIWNRWEGLYRLPERLLVLGEFDGPGFLTGHPFAESPTRLRLVGPEGDQADLGGTALLPKGRHLAVAGTDHEGVELHFRNFDAPAEAKVPLAESYQGAGWLVSGSAELDGGKELCAGRAEAPIPFHQHCHPLAGTEIIRGAARTASDGGWLMADIELLKENGLWVQNLSKPEELSASWPNGLQETRIMACHLNEMRWTISSDLPITGIVLFRIYDAFHGLSQARVFVNERLVGRWFCPIQDRVNRWRHSSFGVEFAEPLDPGETTITIDPPAGAPLWSVSAYRWLLLHD